MLLDMLSNTPAMDATEYKMAFEKARAEMEELIEQREEIDKRIAQLKQAIIALAPMAGKKPDILADWSRIFAEFGITDAIREVLHTADMPLTPLEVRDRLIQMKPDLQTQANLMASIHTVLKRLGPSQATSFANNDGDVVYEWKASPSETTGLTPRQRKLLRLVANGLTNKEIAEKLSLSEFTVKNHVRRLLRQTEAQANDKPSDVVPSSIADTLRPRKFQQ
jgi:DNA-binding CsgD family transcriptional regulator